MLLKIITQYCKHCEGNRRNTEVCLFMCGILFIISMFFVTGDGAYPLSKFMVTPFRNLGNLTAPQNFYNNKISSVRQSVERAIGHIKGRFRRLRDVNCENMQDACYLIMSACILHNLCILSCEDLSEFLELNGTVNQRVNNYPALYRDNVDGINRRNRLVLHLQRFMNT